MIIDSSLFKRACELGEDQAGKLVQMLMDNDKFSGALQTVVNNSLKAKGALDKQVRVVLSAMSLPTSEDMENLKNKMDVLEQSIQRLEQAVEKLSADASKDESEKDESDESTEEVDPSQA